MVSESCGLPSPSTNSDSNNFSASRLNRITNPVTSSNNPNIYSAVVINGNNNSSSSASPSNNLIQNNLINTMSHHIGNHSNNHSDHVPSAKVVGLILWPEGSFSVQQHSSNATLKPSSSSLSPFQSAFSKGLVLGSILLDSKESTMFADELRQLVTGQIPNITFGFLSKEGWVTIATFCRQPTTVPTQPSIITQPYHADRLHSVNTFIQQFQELKKISDNLFAMMIRVASGCFFIKSDKLSGVRERNKKKGKYQKIVPWYNQATFLSFPLLRSL